MIILLTPKKISKAANRTAKLIEEGIKKTKNKILVAEFEEGEVFVEKNVIKVNFSGVLMEGCSTIFLRKVGRYKSFAFIISQIAKKHKIKFFDRLYIETNDFTKLVQTVIYALNEILIPKSYYSPVYNKKKRDRAIQFLKLPIIVKKCNSAQGNGVFLVNNELELKNILFKLEGKEVILQEFIENSFEYRVLVLGKKVSVVEKKTRTDKNEFRNNVYLGAKEEFLDLSIVRHEVKKIARKAAMAVNTQVAGVDIIESKNGELFVIETNRTPAFTHDEKKSNEIAQLVKFLIKCEKIKN